jgi:hypothetical protein
MYPNADNSEVTGNVIDSNGEGVIFAGTGGETSDNNVVEHNIITNSGVRQNVESYWGSGPVGSGNVVTNNCIKGAADPYYATANGSGIMNPQVGFTASSNLIADPKYINAAAGNYNLQSDSPCASILGGSNAPPPATSDPPPSTGGGSTTTTPTTTTPPPSTTPTTPKQPSKKKPRRRRAKARR